MSHDPNTITAQLHEIRAMLHALGSRSTVPAPTMSVEEVAAAMGITPANARHWCRRHTVPGGFKPDGAKSWRFSRPIFEDWVRQRVEAAATKRAEFVETDNPTTPRDVFVGNSKNQPLNPALARMMGAAHWKKEGKWREYVFCVEEAIRELKRKAGGKG